MEFDFRRPVWVRWKNSIQFGRLVRQTNHGKSYLVRLANGLLRQVKPERIFQ